MITSLCYAVEGSFRIFKKIFGCLEYCVILISYLLKKRKLMFLRQMLHLEEHYMFYRPGIAQLINSTKGNNFQKFKKTFNFYSLKIEGSHNSVISFEHLIFTWSGSPTSPEVRPIPQSSWYHASIQLVLVLNLSWASG